MSEMVRDSATISQDGAPNDQVRRCIPVRASQFQWMSAQAESSGSPWLSSYAELGDLRKRFITVAALFARALFVRALFVRVVPVKSDTLTFCLESNRNPPAP